MAIILHFVVVSFVPKMVMPPVVMLAVLRGVCSTVMTGKSITIVGAGLAVAMSTAVIVVACAGHSSSQGGEHDSKHKYPHFRTSID
jgi:hypothetical protein